MTSSAWGAQETQYFFELTPDRVLAAVEAAGLVCTGRCFTLNSFENRVYDIELEMELEAGAPRSSRHRIIKFYRPGRWSEAQILEEHAFLSELAENEIPVVAALPFPDGSTLRKTSDGGIWYALFPKIGGRAPDELSMEQAARVGRLLGRIHNVGAARSAQYRMKLTPQTYGRANLEFLLAGNWILPEFRSQYGTLAEKIFERIEPAFASTPVIRVHGDCHLGNLIWGNLSGSETSPFFVDFDDMLMAPAVQDLWLLLPGESDLTLTMREALLEGYEEMRAFDRTTLRLIEPLRALRFIHYTAWIARRWKDPAFPLAFPGFGTSKYWGEMTQDLENQWLLIQDAL